MAKTLPPEEASPEVPPVVDDPYSDYEAHTTTVAASIWQYDELDFDLNLEEQLFVRSYVIDRNPVACLRRLGYSDPPVKLRARAKRFMSNPEVNYAIEFLARRTMEKLDITAEKVQRQIAAIAFFDPREVVTFDKFGVGMVSSRFWSQEQAAAIKSIKMGEKGLQIDFYDRLKASEMLAKQLGVQPEENNLEASFRIAADQAMDKIGAVLGRLLPGGRGVQAEMTKKDPLLIEHDAKDA